MDKALRLHITSKMKMIAYADDLAIAVAATNIQIAQDRIPLILDRVIGWAEERGLNFSSQKTQVMTLKGGLKPGYQIKFGNDSIDSWSSVKYVGVLIDYERNYWNHLKKVSNKSESMYSRMSAATSVNWEIRKTTSRVIFKVVFLPRIKYAVSIWEKALLTNKAIKLLGSKQRHPLISLTGAYKTTSTDALQVVSGCLPLDLELRLLTTKEKVRNGQEIHARIEETQEEILRIWLYGIWYTRWEQSTKGRWTYEWFPNIKERYWLPIELDHFVTQFITRTS